MGVAPFSPLALGHVPSGLCGDLFPLQGVHIKSHILKSWACSHPSHHWGISRVGPHLERHTFDPLHCCCCRQEQELAGGPRGWGAPSAFPLRLPLPPSPPSSLLQVQPQESASSSLKGEADRPPPHRRPHALLPSLGAVARLRRPLCGSAISLKDVVATAKPT